MKDTKQLFDTPLSISTYSVVSSPTRMNNRGVVELIFCIKGSVRFGYGYEEFELNAGDFVSVDRDAYYLYDGKDNICTSFLIDLTRYEDRYPDISHAMFVCEGIPKENEGDVLTEEHMKLKGLMIAIMKAETGMSDDNEELHRTIIQKICDEMVELLITHFDIMYFHTQKSLSPKANKQIREIMRYMRNNYASNPSIEAIADLLNVSTGYVSELMCTNFMGYRNMLGYIRAVNSEWYLLNTDKTIIEIAETCGFSSTKYFYSTFRKWYNCGPREFRLRCREFSDSEVNQINIMDAKKIIDEMLIKHFMFSNTGVDICIEQIS